MRTQAGLIMGSPAYMSPEQCKDSADVDLRSDIYSFATIMYEMLAGRTPYVAASGTEMLVMHLTATPAPVRELATDVPAHVEAAITRALSRTRDDRFDSMESFLGALRGEAGAGLLGRLSPSGELLAVGGGRVPGAERTVAVPSITTFSRATGEVGPAASDDVLLQASRTRRWPIFAIGGAAVAGLALFLLVRPSHESAPRPTPGTLRVEVPDAAVARAAVGGAAPTELTGAPSAARLPDAAVPAVVDGVRPSPKRRVRASATPHPINNRRTENPWVVH
jgi:serine/threonine-protein kinase